MRNGAILLGALALAILAYLFWPSREAVEPPVVPATTEGQDNG